MLSGGSWSQYNSVVGKVCGYVLWSIIADIVQCQDHCHPVRSVSDWSLIGSINPQLQHHPIILTNNSINNVVNNFIWVNRITLL